MYREVTMIEVKEVLRLWRRGRQEAHRGPAGAGSEDGAALSRVAAAAGSVWTARR